MKALALLVLLAVAGIAGCAERPPAADEVVVDVLASRYRFEPGTDAPIEVAVGTTIVFRLTSSDVTHGFAIEGLHPGVEVLPGETVELRVTVREPGTFTLYCTVFCGPGHPQHKGVLQVTAA